MRRSCFLIALIACCLTSCSGGGGETPGGGTTTAPPPGGGTTVAPIITPLFALPGVTHLQSHHNRLFWFDDDPFAHFKSWPTAGGPISPLAMRMGRPFKIALSGQDVFWTEGPPNGVIPSGMQIKKVAPDGTVTLLAAEQPSCASGSTDELIVDGSSIYYVTASACSAALVSHIVKLPLNNDPPTEIITTSRTIWSLSSDSTHLYWIEKDDLTGQYDLKRIPKAGGVPQTLFSSTIVNNLGLGITIGNGQVFFSETTSPQGGYQIRQIPTTGGASTVLFDKPLDGPVQSIAADNTNVYWADNTGIRTIAGTGGTASTLVNVPESFMTITLSGTTLYWMETRCCTIPQSSTINRVSTSGGTSTSIQQGLGFIGGTNRSSFGGALVVGNGNIYWTEGGSTLAHMGYGKIASSLLTGGTVQTVASGIVSISPTFHVTDQFIYIADHSALKKLPISGGFPEFIRPLDISPMASTGFNGFATDGTAVYFKNPLSAHLIAAPVDGSALSEIPSDLILEDVLGLTFANGRLYWIANGNTIRSLPRSGGTISTVLTSQGLFDLIADLTHIYFIQGGSFFSTINKLLIAGGTPSLLVPTAAISSSQDMTQDDQSVYWSNATQVGKASKTTGALSFYELIVKGSGGGIAVDDTSAFWIRDDVLFRATPK